MAKKEKIYIKTFDGFGDNLYTRSVIKELIKNKDVYIQTPLPDIYRDLPVKFVYTQSEYRTQSKIKPSKHIKFNDAPDIKAIELKYDQDLYTSNVMTILLKKVNLPLDTKLEWDLPDFTEELSELNLNIPLDKKIAIVRPSTIRMEWPVPSRAADQTYINWCSSTLMDWGYHVISVADLEKDKEWLYNNMDIHAHQKFYKGEVPIYALLELIKKAELVVGGSGFIVPATVSANTNLFLILGGRLGYDSPAKTLHPTMDMSKISCALPTNPCRCGQDDHDCDKRIHDIDYKFLEFVSKNNK